MHCQFKQLGLIRISVVSSSFALSVFTRARPMHARLKRNVCKFFFTFSKNAYVLLFALRGDPQVSTSTEAMACVDWFARSSKILRTCPIVMHIMNSIALEFRNPSHSPSKKSQDRQIFLARSFAAQDVRNCVAFITLNFAKSHSQSACTTTSIVK